MLRGWYENDYLSGFQALSDFYKTSACLFFNLKVRFFKIFISTGREKFAGV